MNKERHILGISGGKDSAALAVYMSQKFPELDIEYFFTDTGEELPEVYSYLTKLEGYLGKQIIRLNPPRNFQHHLKIYGYWLPSAKQRWCTDKLKIKPLEKWIKPDLDKGVKITSYVDSRSTTVHLMTSVLGGASLSSEHKRLIRISAAFFPISSLCWLTVVRVGVENFEINPSVKQTTAISFGTCMCA